jgi:hypothetical protein
MLFWGPSKGREIALGELERADKCAKPWAMAEGSALEIARQLHYPFAHIFTGTLKDLCPRAPPLYMKLHTRKKQTMSKRAKRPKILSLKRLRREKKVSPIKEKPLPQAGQSLRLEIQDLVFDKAMMYILASSIAVQIVFYEWFRFFINSPPRPIHLSFIAVIVWLVSFVQVKRILKEKRRKQQALDGERLVGEQLDLMRSAETLVYHDLPFNGFNIDHVILSTKGIYVLETKTYSKLENGEYTIYYDGKKISIKDRGTFTKELEQVKAASMHLQKMLYEWTGKRFTVKPVLLFPGWFIRRTARLGENDVQVLNPKELPKFMQAKEYVLPFSDVNLASHHLVLDLRHKEKQRLEQLK